MTQTEALKLALEALEKLWNIIDDIDTYGDMAKGDEKLYRALVERRQRTRFEETGISTDGYELTGGAIKAINEALAQPEQEPLANIKPNYNMTFHNGEKQVGALDFNGPEMVFTGDADESAKVFFDYVARAFKARLDQERADERNSWPAEMEAMERQVNILTDALADEREACANLVFHSPPYDEYESPLMAVYNAIRARSST